MKRFKKNVFLQVHKHVVQSTNKNKEICYRIKFYFLSLQPLKRKECHYENGYAD